MFSLQEEGKQQTWSPKVFCSKATAAIPNCLPQSWRAAFPKADCGYSSMGPSTKGDFQEQTWGAGTISRRELLL